MNRELILAAAALAAVAAVASPPLRAQTFNAFLDARATEAAERGPDALRTFVHRTRMIHALNYADYSGSLPQADVISAATDPGWDLAPAIAASGPDKDVSADQRALDELREQIFRDMLHE